VAEIELANYIEALRSELEAAISQGENKTVRFGLEKIDLDIEVSVDTSGQAKATGKFKFWVVNAGVEASAKLGMKTTQKLKLTLVPTRLGQPISVNSEDDSARQ
jgi:hypothetical protein